MKLTRAFFASALLAAAFIPFAATVNADHHGNKTGERGNVPERMQERMEERRQAVYEQAGISEEKQTQLNEARESHYDAMREVREAHYGRMQEILTEDEQAALQEAMRDMHKESRDKRGYHGERGMAPDTSE
ncbi:hypothetical protein QC823_00820 [Halomonas vilamensis]|uniref:Uncharacterized protein n=1 Tax=Vreelandella vilamensis TaxID=531309 RepID=A0ABU1GZR5_9GAMM|nr:hypothetical protein [Halomonas vilamensis]MDR5897536.1 hypothetical protein [Halomonas vilamensis]